MYDVFSLKKCTKVIDAHRFHRDAEQIFKGDGAASDAGQVGISSP